MKIISTNLFIYMKLMKIVHMKLNKLYIYIYIYIYGIK